MSVRKFKFVSPGVFINEIDNSQLPRIPEAVGPVIVGRAERGPALRPVTVNSFSDFVEVFGNPIPGGQGGDVWRDGNHMAPTYGAYAAQAWLRNNSPLTYVRVIGAQHDNATSAGKAGWKTAASPNGDGASNGGAFGLFVCQSGSNQSLSAGTGVTGSLAAVFYLNEGSIVLSGTDPDNSREAQAAHLIHSIGANNEFKVLIKDASGNVKEKTSINFSETSKKFIRNVLNTNPTLVNSTITNEAQQKTYWVGETYEHRLSHYVTSAGSTGDRSWGVILGLGNSTNSVYHHDLQMNSQAAQTGWFISQDTTTNSGSYAANAMTKLFKFHTLNQGGEWEQANLKISIQDIKASTNLADPYGSFSVVVRKAQDTDAAPQVVERFSSCNLNPFSPNYIAKKIGDAYVTWDDNDRRYREYGNYPNRSRFFRVEINGDCEAGATDPQLLPFGVWGPPVYNSFAIGTGSSTPLALDGAAQTAANRTVIGNQDIPTGSDGASIFVSMGSGSLAQGRLAFHFPTVPLRVSSSDGNLANPKDAYFGARTGRSATSPRFARDYVDLVRPKGSGQDSFSNGNMCQDSWVFSLDDLKMKDGEVAAIYYSGSRKSGDSMTAVSGTWKQVLDMGFNRFTAPVFGGFDGLDIKEKEPFRNTGMSGTPTEKTNYAFNSLKRAIDSVADPEVVEMNLLAVPGVTQNGITDHVINVCEDRADALAVIDLDGGYVPATENTNAIANRMGSVKETVDNLEARAINSSYACAYYPWVQIRDTINGAMLWAPPSIAAIGTFASSERSSELWFAPAGFTRGGLTEGSAGIPVVGVRERLTSKDRDDLYEANVNPIASFPAEGIVIFGQKTLQVTPSALDRVNVRRLMIYLKKEISRMAATVLFDQNVLVTWNGFRGRVEQFLADVKARVGLTDYRLILDNTTTTPDLIDRNIMYAKIFLKPAKAIEFIAIDFVITDSGASFED